MIGFLFGARYQDFWIRARKLLPQLNVADPSIFLTYRGVEFRHVALLPIGAIKGAVLHGFGHVLVGDVFEARQIGIGKDPPFKATPIAALERFVLSAFR